MLLCTLIWILLKPILMRRWHCINQMDRLEKATRSFHRAGELALRNEVIVNSALYRSHWALSSPLERLLSGGYRYQP